MMMHTKFVIFVIIGSLLVAAIYSSSTYFVSAATTYCTGTSKTTTTCIVYDEKGFTVWDCKLNKDGKTWSCKEDKTPRTAGSISPSLTAALNKATLAEVQANITGVNDTKVLDRLNDLRGMNEQSIDSNDNNDTKVPKDLGGLNDNGDRLTN
jgi:hypothetical protein